MSRCFIIREAGKGSIELLYPYKFKVGLVPDPSFYDPCIGHQLVRALLFFRGDLQLMLFHRLKHMQVIHVHPPLLPEVGVWSIDFDVHKGNFYAGCFDDGMLSNGLR